MILFDDTLFYIKLRDVIYFVYLILRTVNAVHNLLTRQGQMPAQYNQC